MTVPTPEPTTTPEPTPEPAPATYVAPATQADLDRIIADRINRTKAQFKDYGDLKTKADKFDLLDAQTKTDAQRAAEETARWQTEAERWRTTAVAAKVQALAATDFADPDDAVRGLDPAKYLDAGGVIDEAAIKADLAALLDAKPHYRRAEGVAPPRVPAPNAAQGASATGRTTPDPAQEFAAIVRGQLPGP
jgi:hypothetical protein